MSAIFFSPDFPEDPLDARDALLTITIYAVDDPGYREKWEQAVREGADAVCAQIAGARMAGRTTGAIEWTLKVPAYPAGELTEQDVLGAYRLAVRNLAQSRLDSMTQHPPGGLG